MNYSDLFGSDLGILTDPDVFLYDQQFHHLFVFGCFEPVFGSYPMVFLVTVLFSAFNIGRLQREYIRIRRRTDC